MNGDVQLRIEGLLLERLIVRALNEGAEFRRIRRMGPKTMVVEADSHSAEILSALCRRFSIPCVILSRRGRNAVLHRLKKRASLLAGMLSCLVCMCAFFSRIWLIDIQLADGQSSSVRPLEEALESLDIRPGIPASALEPAQLEKTLAAISPDYSYIGVRRQGVRLLVEASPAVNAPELYSLSGGSDLVAARDAVVLCVTALAGEACVQPGDTVIRGQMLIRGEERISGEETREIPALGSVIARTWHEGSAAADSLQETAVRTGRSSTSAELRLMSLSWTLNKGESYPQQETETQSVPIGGLFLPLEIRRTTAYETQSRAVQADIPELRIALGRLAFASAGAELTRSHPGGCEIADRWIEYTQAADGRIAARAVYETHSDIAVTRDALYQQGGQYIGND